MLKAPLLSTELKTRRGRAGQWQRCKRDLRAPTHHWSNALKGEVHILPGCWAPAHQLLDLVPRGLGSRRARRWRKGSGRGLRWVGLGLLLSLAAGEGPGPLQLVLDVLRAAAMVHYRPLLPA